MNRFTLLLISLFMVSAGFAQNNVVNWTFESKKLADKKYEVKLIATVQQLRRYLFYYAGRRWSITNKDHFH